jgi:hypothetical protein
LAFFCLCGHTLAFFRFFEVALDPGTHTVSPMASNPFTIWPIYPGREEATAVIYCHFCSVRFESVLRRCERRGVVGEFVRPQRLPIFINRAMIAWDAIQPDDGSARGREVR